MPQVLKQAVTKVITKDGECTITIQLELNINLNANGIVGVAAKADAVQDKSKPEEDTNWMMPDLRNVEKIKFGKIVGE